MNEPSREKEPAGLSLWRKVFGRPLPLETETTRYILVSTLDVFMTYIMLRFREGGSPIGFVESNPIARFFLDHWGVKGLVYFKFVMVAIVVVIAQIVVRKKPETALLLLNAATIVVAGVVVYSLILFLRNTGAF